MTSLTVQRALDRFRKRITELRSQGRLPPVKHYPDHFSINDCLDESADSVTQGKRRGPDQDRTP